MEPKPNPYQQAFEILSERVEKKVEPGEEVAFYSEANAVFMKMAHDAQDATFLGFTNLLRKIRGDQ